MNFDSSVFKTLARYSAIIGTITLAVYLIVNLAVEGALYTLMNTNSTFGVEQSLGAVGYVLLALCSPVVSSILLCFALVFFLTARSIDKQQDEDRHAHAPDGE